MAIDNDVKTIKNKEKVNLQSRGSLSLMRNFAYNSILTVANLIFPLITFTYVSRIIGPEKLGTVNFASTLVNYFVIFGIFGLNQYGTREIARVRDDPVKLKATFNELFCIDSFTTTIALGSYIIFILLNEKARSEPLLYWVNGITVLFSLFSFDFLFQGLENYRFISMRSILVKAISLVFLFVFVKKKEDYLIYAFINVFGLSANYLFNGFYAYKLIGFDFYHIHISRHFPALFQFALISFSTTLYLGMDKLFLGYMSNDYYVGLYTPAEKIARLSLSLITALSTVIFPRLSNMLYKGDLEESKGLIKSSLHSVLMLAIPIFVGIELLSRPLIEVLSGNQYLPSITTLRIEALIIIPVAVANVAGIQVLIGSGKENKYFFSILFGAVAFCLCAFLLIPSMKQNGAAIGIVAAETVGVIFECYWGRSYFKGISIMVWLPKILIASGVMACWIWILSLIGISNILLIFLAIIGGVILYFSMLIILKDSLALRLKKKILGVVLGNS
jgi:O-antigen/teichoic acid export membrane protein